jgi:hypothetical protein
MPSLAEIRQADEDRKFKLLDDEFGTLQGFKCIVKLDSNVSCSRPFSLKRRGVNHKEFIKAAKNPDLDLEAWAKVFAPRWCCSSHPPTPEKPRDDIFEFVIPIMIKFQKAFPAERPGAQSQHHEYCENEQTAGMSGSCDTSAMSAALKNNADHEQKPDPVETASKEDTLDLEARLEAKFDQLLDAALRAKDAEADQKIAAVKADLEARLEASEAADSAQKVKSEEENAAIKADFREQLSDLNARFKKKLNRHTSELKIVKDTSSAREAELEEKVTFLANAHDKLERKLQWLATEFQSVQQTAALGEKQLLEGMTKTLVKISPLVESMDHDFDIE